MSITVHQRRAAKAARQRSLELSRRSDAMRFARPMRILVGRDPFRIIRVNYRRGTLRMEGLIRS